MGSVELSIATPRPLEVGVSSSPALGVQVAGYAVVYQSLPDYTGATTVTPTQAQQTLLTEDTTLRSNIIINPIPSNYGRITWNGSVLTVS